MVADIIFGPLTGAAILEEHGVAPHRTAPSLPYGDRAMMASCTDMRHGGMMCGAWSSCRAKLLAASHFGCLGCWMGTREIEVWSSISRRPRRGPREGTRLVDGYPQRTAKHPCERGTGDVLESDQGMVRRQHERDALHRLEFTVHLGRAGCRTLETARCGTRQCHERILDTRADARP